MARVTSVGTILTPGATIPARLSGVIPLGAHSLGVLGVLAFVVGIVLSG